MKKLITGSLLAVLLLQACSKDEYCPMPETVAPASEIASLEQYLQANSIQATKDEHGFYYEIITPGGDSKPDNCDKVSVTYKGQLTNGSVFDEQTSPTTLTMSNLIKGWQQGIPLIGITGKIRLYIPPSLGYGSVATSGIPANSILIFDVSLVGF